MDEILLALEHLTCAFDGDDGEIIAVDDVSFTVNKGETIGLVGESGCGKSVTSLSIVRLLEFGGGKIIRGSIYFKGQDLVKKSPKEMRRINGNQIAMIFQEPMSSLNPMLTIGYQLVETIKRHQKLDKEAAAAKAVKMLELVGINEAEKRLKSYPFQLSGGQKQRVMIAMALSCNPDLLIADEPTTALDVTIQAQILDLMKDLKERLGMSIILITHDLGVVADMAQRVVVMYGGQIVEINDAAQIFVNPLHPYTQGLLKAIPRMEKVEGHLYMIPGVIPQASQYPAGCRFAPRCERAMAICQKVSPQMTTLENGRQVRCHLYQQKGAGNAKG